MKNIFWSISDNVLQQVINFVVGIVLARILTPDEFGLVGIILVVVLLLETVIDAGLSSALIYKKDATKQDFNTVFTTNLLLAGLFYLLLYITSDALADFFNRKELAGFLRLAGIELFFFAVQSIYRTILIKELNFKYIAIVSLVSVTVSGSVAIALAYNDFEIYSLIYRVIVGQLLTAFLFWLFVKVKVKFQLSKSSLSHLYAYGNSFFYTNLLMMAHNSVVLMAIGKLFNTQTVGYYTRGAMFRDIVSVGIVTAVKRVSFSTLSKLKNRDEQLKEFSFFLKITIFIIGFSMLFMFFNAKEIIIILLSEKWLESVKILRILSSAVIFIAIYELLVNFFAVIGKEKVFLTLEMGNKFLVLPIIFLGYKYGLNVMLWAFVAQSITVFGIAMFLMKVISNSTVLRLVLDLFISYVLPFGLLYLIELYGYEGWQWNIYNVFLAKALVISGVFLLFNMGKVKLFINMLLRRTSRS